VVEVAITHYLKLLVLTLVAIEQCRLDLVELFSGLRNYQTALKCQCIEALFIVFEADQSLIHLDDHFLPRCVASISRVKVRFVFSLIFRVCGDEELLDLHEDIAAHENFRLLELALDDLLPISHEGCGEFEVMLEHKMLPFF
jgi:hypothetical protein